MLGLASEAGIHVMGTQKPITGDSAKMVVQLKLNEGCISAWLGLDFAL